MPYVFGKLDCVEENGLAREFIKVYFTGCNRFLLGLIRNWVVYLVLDPWYDVFEAVLLQLFLDQLGGQYLLAIGPVLSIDVK